ncbi:hypothetical protein NKH18_50430 [Streptomyces sp. M10(2022)]
MPHDRTVPADLAVTAPPAGHTIRAPRTGGEDDDLRRLGMTGEDGRPLPGVTRLPDDANVDLFRGAEALRDAFHRLTGGTYPGAPATGTFGRLAGAVGRQLPAAVSGPVAYLAGASPQDQSAFAGEVLDHQVRAASLIGRAHQIFNGGYVVEGLVLPGLGADQQMYLEIQGYLHHPSTSVRSAPTARAT